MTRRLGVLLLCLTFAPSSYADDSVAYDSVALSIADCAGASGEAVSKLVALELSPQLAVVAAAPMHAELRCSDQQASITVRDARATHQLTLSLLDTAPEARPRLLALAIAELVATSRLEQPTPALVATPPREPTPVPARRFHATSWLAVGVLRDASPRLWSPTLALGFGYDFGALRGQSDLAFESGSARGPRALLRAHVLSLSVAPMLAVLRGRCSIGLGVGLRAGWAWLSARPRDDGLLGKALSGPYVAPIARGALVLALSERWSTRLDLELGYPVKSVRGLDADGNTLLKLSGLRSTASLGVGVALR